MKKYVLIILSIITTHACAMKTSEPYCFPNITDRITNYIASFLTDENIEAQQDFTAQNTETEQEFIERTKALKIEKVPERYLKHFPESLRYSPNPRYCPNNKIIIFSNGNCIINYNNKVKQNTLVKVIDSDSNKLLSTVHVQKVGLWATAISGNGKLLAICYMKFDHSKNKKDPDWKEIVNIVNLTTADTEKYDIPHSFALPGHNTHPTIAFNKQGTHIIVHGNDHDKLQDLSWDEIKQNPIRHHIIFPITLNTPKTCPLSTLPTDVLDHIASYLTFDVETEQEFIDKIYPLTINTPNPDVDTKKTFINYFKQKLILKDPAKQITLTK